MAGREPDKPGSYRIKPKGEGWQVSGVDVDGARVKFVKRTLGDAEEAARSIFGNVAPIGVKVPELGAPRTPLEPLGTPLDAPADDWGLPAGIKINAQTASMFAPKVPDPGAAPGAAPAPAPTDEQKKAEKERAEKQEKRRDNAKSIAGMIGYGYAMGLVYVTRTSMEESRAVVRPDSKELKKLQENVKDGITETFGDTEVGPWTMVFLLTFAIPISMWLQSRKLTPEELEERARERRTSQREKEREHLRPVP